MPAPWIGLQFVIVVFPDHTHLDFFRNLYHEYNTVVGQCRIYCTFKIYHLCQILLSNTIELVFLLYHNMLNHTVLTFNIIVAWNVYLL